MKHLLVFSAAGEAALGLVLLVYPPIVVRLLFNAPIEGAGMVISRIAGMALIALGLACWTGRAMTQAFWGMLTYGTLATLYLAYLGIDGECVGSLLWPAVVAHAILTILLGRAWFQEQRTTRQVRNPE